MRTPLVAGNWKLHFGPDHAADHAHAIRATVDTSLGVEVVVCPPFVSLMTVAIAMASSGIAVGAQDGFPTAEGAYTGEVSMAMLPGVASYVIVGHSERREYFHESDEFVARKLAAALDAGLRPILCVGETLEQRRDGRPLDLISAQTWNALMGLDDPSGVVVAYEPIWAIGTGHQAEPADAVAAADRIRDTIARIFDRDFADSVRVLYGGSVTAENAGPFFREAAVDGALVGGASLHAENFAAIVRAAAG